MIYLKGTGDLRLIVGAIGEPNLKELVSKSGKPFTVCDVGISTGLNAVDGKSIYTTIKAFGRDATELGECRKGDWLWVVGTEKTEHWENAHGGGTKTLVEIKKFGVLKESGNSGSGSSFGAVKSVKTGEKPLAELTALDDIDDADMPF